MYPGSGKRQYPSGTINMSRRGRLAKGVLYASNYAQRLAKSRKGNGWLR